MKKILVFVSTLDGKVTQGDDPFVRKWSSTADQEYFSRLFKDSRLIVMGSNTYNAAPIKSSLNSLMVIMTREPSKYAAKIVTGQMEFTDEAPRQIVTRFEKQGYKLMTVVGGPHVATSFLKDGLIDELWLTLEPLIFGQGESLVAEEKLNIRLKLLSCEKLNDEGTLLTKYAVVKPA